MNLRMKQYQNEAVKTRLADASPYHIIQMLMTGVMDNLALAKGAIERNDLEAKSKAISKASAIISALRSSLDFNVEGEISDNLNGLYEYMADRLVDASVSNDTEIILEVANLFREIKSAWDEIPQDAIQDAEKQRLASVG